MLPVFYQEFTKNLFLYLKNSILTIQILRITKNMGKFYSNLHFIIYGYSYMIIYS